MRRSTSRSRGESRSSSGSRPVIGVASPALPANASRTKPASRGEKTASPASTRRIAWRSSSPEMVLVTYPLAPARITAITSSGASDTDRARKWTSGWRGRTPLSTACPPPPGRWTSSRTTPGRRSLMSSTAASTSSASPTTSTASPSSARTPARNMAWSSTRNTRGRPWSLIGPSCSTDRLGSGHRHLDLDPAPGGGTYGHRAPEPGHTCPDRTGDALAIARYRAGVESPTAVSHVEGDRVAVDFGVERDLYRPGPLGGIDGGLPGGIEQRPEPFGQVTLPDHHGVHGDAVIGLDLALDGSDALGQRSCVVRARGPTFEQPGAELAFLGPGQTHDLAGVVGGTLDQCQRLEHGVVHVGRHPGPLLGHGTGLALGHEVPHQAEPPRAEHHDHGGHGQHGAAEQA